MRVGFIGLGSQGGPMARRIVEGGFETTLWARRAASLEPYADTAAKSAGSPAELAAASDLVCVCVVGDDDVREVLYGESGVLAGLASGGIVAIHSTVHPDTCREIAEKAAAQGVSLIDAPVSGGAPAVEEGKLLVMIGGEEDVADRCRPVFATYADPIVHLGPVGSGQVTKILNNLLFTANLGSAATTLELGKSLGIPRRQPRRGSERWVRDQQGARQRRGHGGQPGAAGCDRRRAAAEGRSPRGEPRGRRVSGGGRRVHRGRRRS